MAKQSGKAELREVIERIVNSATGCLTFTVESPQDILELSRLCVEEARSMSKFAKLETVTQSVFCLGGELIDIIEQRGYEAASRELTELIQDRRYGRMNTAKALFGLVVLRLKTLHRINPNSLRVTALLRH